MKVAPYDQSRHHGKRCAMLKLWVSLARANVRVAHSSYARYARHARQTKADTHKKTPCMSTAFK
ncbi:MULTISPECIES: hypothetical protein [unclassified Paraburkholderia]|uniref:hypothetical protein n=1 Tax=unclassified Paraburkholderia TaxID=2615204 RepID=UPI002AB1D662|nr:MULTISPECIES: hypothetical protein [unclassified Paraburkholderia]